MFYNVFVDYEGKTYGYNLSEFSKKILCESSIYIDKEKIDKQTDKTVPVSLICNYGEDGKEIFLDFDVIKFDTVSKSFSTEKVGKSTFNKETFDGNIDDEVFKYFKVAEGDLYTRRRSALKLNESSIYDFVKYISEIANCNLPVYNFFFNKGSHYFQNLVRNNNTFDIEPINCFKLLVLNLIELEKLITSGNETYLDELIRTPDAKLEKGKKLAQVVNLPKFALDYMNENNLISSKETVRKIANEYDGNSLKIIFDTFDKFNVFDKKVKTGRKDSWRYVSKETKRNTFLQNTLFLLERKYKVVDLLNYLLRQRMYWSDLSFGFPYEEAKTLVDYITICEKYGLRCEKYPQNLEKLHNVVIKNIEVLKSDEKQQKKFEDSINRYYKNDIEIDDFVFTVPKNVKDLVLEGDSLHHCIGSYSDNIIKGISRIYFMRIKGKENVSYVTIEVNSNNDLVEFKGDYNKEPEDDETLKAIKKFIKELKK